MKIKIIKKLDEMSAMGGGAVQGHSGVSLINDKPKEEKEEKSKSIEEEDKIEEMYSSAGIMGMGSGRIPSERNPEAHKRYVRMRFINQGLQNFKSNRYFAEDKKKSKKIRIKIKKNLEEKCQKGYKTHEKRKTKKMFGKTYRNCVKAE